MKRAPTQDTDARFVQFADPDAVLITEIGRAMSVALDRGSAVMCIATDVHRCLLEDHLSRAGADLQAARRTRQYVYLDAIDTLSRITIDGLPDVIRFAEVIGASVDRMALQFSRVWIFGDMVALMCAYGNRTGALRLERLWRSFNEAHPVFRYCAYPPNVLQLGHAAEARFRATEDLEPRRPPLRIKRPLREN